VKGDEQGGGSATIGRPLARGGGRKVAALQEFAPAEEGLGSELALLAEGGDGQSAALPVSEGLPPKLFFGLITWLAHGWSPWGDLAILSTLFQILKMLFAARLPL
jgi:hypothetical protein